MYELLFLNNFLLFLPYKEKAPTYLMLVHLLLHLSRWDRCYFCTDCLHFSIHDMHCIPDTLQKRQPFNLNFTLGGRQQCKRENSRLFNLLWAVAHPQLRLFPQIAIKYGMNSVQNPRECQNIDRHAA